MDVPQFRFGLRHLGIAHNVTVSGNAQKVATGDVPEGPWYLVYLRRGENNVSKKEKIIGWLSMIDGCTWWKWHCNNYSSTDGLSSIADNHSSYWYWKFALKMKCITNSDQSPSCKPQSTQEKPQKTNSPSSCPSCVMEQMVMVKRQLSVNCGLSQVTLP